MNSGGNEIGNDDIKKSIRSTFSYGFQDAFGNSQWCQSRDLDDLSLSGSFHEYAFVDAVNKSSTDAFEFDRTLNGAILKRTSPVAKLFYILQDFPEGVISGMHEVSEYSKALREVARKLNLHTAQIEFTANPLFAITPDGLREGDLVNTLVNRLREVLKRSSFRDAIADRKKQFSQQLSKTKRYIQRLVDNSSSLSVLRIDFGYLPIYGSCITLAESDGHLRKFLLELENNQAVGPVAGYWWRREYVSEVGYRYHVILFLDNQKTPWNPDYLQTLGNCWSAASDGRSTLYNHSPHPDKCRSWGVGLISWSNTQEMLLRGIKLMLAEEIHLRLKSDKNFKHSGTGNFPKRLEQGNTDTLLPPYSMNGFTPSGI